MLLMPTAMLAQETGDASLIINEVQVANLDQYLDNANCYGGWVESYNPTAEAIPLKGYSMTDGVNKMNFLSSHGNVPAKGFKTVWFDHYYSAGNYGASSRLQVPFKMECE